MSTQQNTISIPVALASQRLSNEMVNLSHLVAALHGRIAAESGVLNIFTPGFGVPPNMGMGQNPFPPGGFIYPPSNFGTPREKLDITPEKLKDMTDELIGFQKRITDIISK